jgi:hypothetical protein
MIIGKIIDLCKWLPLRPSGSFGQYRNRLKRYDLILGPFVDFTVDMGATNICKTNGTFLAPAHPISE